MLLSLLNCVEPDSYDNQEACPTEEEGRDIESIKNPKGYKRYNRKVERTGSCHTSKHPINVLCSASARLNTWNESTLLL